ncbi:MAG TPA: phosphotransferase [Methylomirabilota bacterium]|nr:phosphotransferase [Methylomirabilota bacterium]
MAEAARPDREALVARFLVSHGWGAARRGRLAGDASFRHYDRLDLDGRPAVLMDAPPPQEDVRPFVAVAELLRNMGYSAPRLYAADAPSGLLLLEDFGDDTYTRLLARGADEAKLYTLAIDLLIDIHRRFAAARHSGLAAFDDARALREVSLLLDWYWPATQDEPVTPELRESYLAAWRAVLPKRHAAPDTLVLFDFHVDNLMLLPGRSGIAACGLLDFQDAVIAPRPFDLVSLLQDVRRDVPENLVAAMRARYLAAFPQLDKAAFDTAYAVIGAQRNTRILGTFSRLLLRDGKPGYLGFLARTWRHVESDLAHPALAPVRAWFARHLPPDRRAIPGLNEALLARFSKMPLTPPQQSRIAELVAQAKAAQGANGTARSDAVAANRVTVPARAMVLAAGFGTRLRPITDTVPKPMVKVAGRPMIDTVIDRLVAIGVKSIVVNTHHLAEVIESHLGARRDLDIVFSREAEILETGGGIRKALPQLGDGPFYVVNGKIVWLNGKTDALIRLSQAWDDAAMDGLLLLQPTVGAVGYGGPGDFFINQVGAIRRRREWEVAPFVYAGIQILHPRLFVDAPDGAFSLNLLYDRAIEGGRLYGIRHDGEWFHVSTPQQLAEVEARIARGGGDQFY